MAFVHHVTLASPFAQAYKPGFLAEPAPLDFGPVKGVSFDDYLWLFLRAHDYRYLVLHDPLAAAIGDPSAVARLKDHLAAARVYSDGRATAFDRERLPTPARPILMFVDGLRSNPFMGRDLRFGVRRASRLRAYSPAPSTEVALQLHASAIATPRTVVLSAEGREIARWTVAPEVPASYISPPFRLPAGLSELALSCDAEERPRLSRDALDDANRPYSLNLHGLRFLDPRTGEPFAAPVYAGRPTSDRR